MYNDKRDFLSIVYKLGNTFRIDVNPEKHIKYVFEELISYFNKIYKVNIKLIETTPSEFRGLMAANEDRITINYSNLLAIRNEAKKKENIYTNYYDDNTFSLYIISSIFHEFVHCLQFLQIQNGKFSEQIYLNAFTNVRYLNIPYIEKTNEAEAYEQQMNMFLYWIKNGYVDSNIVQTYNEQIDSISFINKNVGMNIIRGRLGKIPFVSSESEFIPTSIVANDSLLRANQAWIDYLLAKSPQVFVGLKEPGQKKSPTELAEQYFLKKIMFGEKTLLTLDDKELDELLSVYIYLLVPEITPIVYNNLCEQFGEQEINHLFSIILSKIDERIKEVWDIYNDCTKWYKDNIGFNSEIDKPVVVNKDYIQRKVQVSLSFYNECKQKIDSVIPTLSSTDTNTTEEYSTNNFSNNISGKFI